MVRRAPPGLPRRSSPIFTVANNRFDAAIKNAIKQSGSGSSPSNPVTVPTSTSIVLSQLANLYLLFALNEALVLRATGDLRVWQTVLFVLLVAAADRVSRLLRSLVE